MTRQHLSLEEGVRDAGDLHRLRQQGAVDFLEDALNAVDLIDNRAELQRFALNFNLVIFF